MIVGIDLGTTNSLIGAYIDGAARLFPNPLGSLLTPSAVSVDESGGVIVGEGARDRLVTQPEHSVAHFKRWMGSPRETILGGRGLRAEQLSALVLQSLIADAEAATGQKIEEAVISVPAYFSDAQRTATRVAGQMAGVKVERLINEPTAAALAYGLQERRDGGRFLVFDLGGGTLDVSLIEIFDGVVEVHASAGDNFLGGEDFLDLLATAACTELDLQIEALSPGARAQFRRQIERLKRELSHQPVARLSMEIGGRERAWEIEEARFAELAEPLAQRMRAPLERTLRDASLRPDQLDEIVLVGGATRMPMVARMVARLVGRLPLRHVNPDQAIALGAVVASGLKARDATLEEVILTDVCPYTLGTETTYRDDRGAPTGGFFMPIITRNSPVPVSREERFIPVRDEQKGIIFGIYQGENPRVDKNIKLGELDVPIPPGPSREERGVTVRFTYDINGILQVEVTVDASGARHELILEQNPGALTKEEIAARLDALASLKVHPRARQENLAVLARAERLYEEYVAARDWLQRMIVSFSSILEAQDDRLIASTRSQFIAALNELEQA
jgi:molecular chaperone HscC